MTPILTDKDGVSIYIYSREHLPPHIHAFAGDDEALINIRTGLIFAGNLPGKKLRVVQDWLKQEGNQKNVEENFYELNPQLRVRKITEEKLTGEKATQKIKKKGRK